MYPKDYPSAEPMGLGGECGGGPDGWNGSFKLQICIQIEISP